MRDDTDLYQEIKNEYLTQVVIPEQKPTIQYLLCPIGLVGAGKTTVVKPLAEALSLVRISSDEIRKILKENGHTYEHVTQIAFVLINQ